MSPPNLACLSTFNPPAVVILDSPPSTVASVPSVTMTLPELKIFPATSNASWGFVLLAPIPTRAVASKCNDVVGTPPLFTLKSILFPLVLE